MHVHVLRSGIGCSNNDGKINVAVIYPGKCTDQLINNTLTMSSSSQYIITIRQMSYGGFILICTSVFQ